MNPPSSQSCTCVVTRNPVRGSCHPKYWQPRCPKNTSDLLSRKPTFIFRYPSISEFFSAFDSCTNSGFPVCNCMLLHTSILTKVTCAAVSTTAEIFLPPMYAGTTIVMPAAGPHINCLIRGTYCSELTLEWSSCVGPATSSTWSSATHFALPVPQLSSRTESLIFSEGSCSFSVVHCFCSVSCSMTSAVLGGLCFWCSGVMLRPPMSPPWSLKSPYHDPVTEMLTYVPCCAPPETCCDILLQYVLPSRNNSRRIPDDNPSQNVQFDRSCSSPLA